MTFSKSESRRIFDLIVISTVFFASMTLNAQVQATLDSEISCIVSTCGTENPLEHPFVTTPGLSGKTVSMIQATLKKPIENYMGRLIHLAVLQDQAFKTVMRNASNISLTPQQESFLQSLRYLRKFSEFSTALEMTEKGFSINKEKLKIIFPKSTEDERAAIASLANVIQTSATLDRLSSFTYEEAIRFIEPTLSVIDGQKNQAIQIVSFSGYLTGIVPLYTFVNLVPLTVQKALRGEVLSVAEKKVMLQKITQYYVLVSLSANDVQKAFRKLPLNLTEALQEAQNRYQKSETGMAVQTPKTVKAILQKNVNQCLNKLAYSYAALPSKAQLEAFRNIMAEIGAKARSLVEAKIKTSLQDSFKGEIYFPTAKEDVIAEWSNGLAIGLEESEQTLKTLKTPDLNSPGTLQSFAVMFIGMPKDELFTDVLSYCEKAEPGFLVDHANSATGAITLSWPTIVYPELGASIIAHEIGHTVSANWPQAVMSEKTCLTSVQGTGQYVEEDFADLFAAEIYNQFNGKISDTKLSNLGCALVPRYKGGWTSSTLKNSNSTDSHSSGFYRLIAVGSMTSTQKPECLDYLNKNLTTFTDYCRWQK